MYDHLENELRALGGNLPEPSGTTTAAARRALLVTSGGRIREGGSRRGYRTISLGAVATAAALGIVLAFLIGHSTPRQSAEVTQSHSTSTDRKAGPTRITRAVGPLFSVAQPLHGGKVVGLSQASADLGEAVPLPSTPLADASTVGQVSEARDNNDDGTSTTYVAVSYPASDLVVEYQSPAPYADAAANYKAYVAETPSALAGLASVGEVDGNPALVIDQNKDATQDNPGSVEFLIGDIKVAVIGYQSSKALLAIAESIAARQG
jgi:hypothetical protein